MAETIDISCVHGFALEGTDRVCCDLDLYGGTPPPAKCRRCPSRVPGSAPSPSPPVQIKIAAALSLLAAREAERVVPATIPQSPQPLPRDQWPPAARMVAMWEDHLDVGLGDTIHRLAGRPGLWIEWITKLVGVPCHCADRRKYYNQVYRYNRAAHPGADAAAPG